MQDSDALLQLLRTWSPGLSLADRLTILSALVEYWHGEQTFPPQTPDANLRLPLPLSWVYSEISARRFRAFEEYSSGWVRGDPIVIFNSLRDPRCFEVDGSGMLTFLVEQQAVYRCGTPAGASDGPVFRQEMHSTAWRCCADSLSDFLLWAIVFELKDSREHSMWGLFAPEEAARITAPMVQVDTGNVSTYGTSHRIWHASDLAIISSPNGVNELCLEAVARNRRCLDLLRSVAVWEAG
jgi:hypothetical protein